MEQRKFEVAATNSARLLFEIDEHGLCAVTLAELGSRRRLGDELASIIAERLLRALSLSTRKATSEPLWALSFPEPHCALYVRSLGPRIGMRVEDEAGAVLTDLEFDADACQTWVDWLRAEYERQPLRMDPEERDDVRRLPAFVVYGLCETAAWTVRHPVHVFGFGRRRKQGLRGGVAFCGTPRTMRDNAGALIDAPPGMVYCVFATSDGYVFDWDWIEGDPAEPGAPVGWAERFDGKIDAPHYEHIAGLEGLTPAPTNLSLPWYSIRGDCLFCYFSAEPSYAHRANDDLTVFRALASKALVGFKIKNVRPIVSEMGENAVRVDDHTQEVSVSLLLEHTKRELRIRMQSEEEEREWLLLVSYAERMKDKTIRIPREEYVSAPCSSPASA